MTATGKTYGDALYDLAAEEALCDELLEQVKLLARLFRENPQYPALRASPDIPREERLHLIGEALTGQVLINVAAARIAAATFIESLFLLINSSLYFSF